VIRISDKLRLISSSYFQQVVRFLAMLIMYRFIGPNDKGIYMALVYTTGLVMALQDFSIPQAVIQIRDEPEEIVFDTGIVLISLLYLFYGAFAIGSGYYLTYHDKAHNPQYWRIGFLYAISSFLSGLYNVQLARLNRRLQFTTESRQNVIFATSVAVTGIIFSVLHYGAYALVFQLLAGQIAANVAINFNVPLTMPRRASLRVAKKFVKLGAPASIAAYIRCVEAPIVGLVVVPIAGTFGLGLWSQAQQIQQMFGQNLLASFQRVAYPMVCQAVSDAARLKKLAIRITLILMMISLWFTAVVAINSHAVVQLCLSKQWSAASPLLTVTAWAIPAGALDMVAYVLCMALGISTSFVRSAVLNLVFFIPAVFIMKHFGGGMIGLAICWSVSRYFIALTTLAAVRRKLEFGLRDVAKPLAALAAAMFASCGIMYVIRQSLHAHSLLVEMAVSGIAGSLVYITAVRYLEPGTLRDARNMARGRSAAEIPQPMEEVLVATTENPAGEEGTLWPAAEARSVSSK
jgi:O-antigen/teichoic acid export membrane protein